MAGPLTRWTQPAALAIWWLALTLPAATVFLPTHEWDVHPLGTFGLSVACLVALRLAAGHRAFLLLTYPLALFGLFAAAANLLRNADVLELVALGALRPDEVAAALQPYAWALAATTLGLAAVLALAWPHPVPRTTSFRARNWIALLAAGGALAWWTPMTAARSWPLNLLTVVTASTLGRFDLLATTMPYAQVNPREPGASWNPRRQAASAPARETYVLVIGESVRADRLRACGGRAGWPTDSEQRLVFCDVMASSSSTHTSVPLLVSRELPGGGLRVSRDATFLRAFEQSGFKTTWLSVQERSIAWPDAQEAHYLLHRGTDQAGLLAGVQQQLASGPDKQMLVVHAYNAHYPYCAGFDLSSALVPVNCGALGLTPTAGNRPAWLDAYDNAVHESMRFLDLVYEVASARGGEVFLLYTSDHGENLLDDDRALFQHALGAPSRWDTRVPLVAMANAAWRARQAARWQHMQRNLAQPLMHADVVPTLLGAADITYDEPRTTVVDLTRASPGARTRLVVQRLGHAVDGDRLK